MLYDINTILCYAVHVAACNFRGAVTRHSCSIPFPRDGKHVYIYIYIHAYIYVYVYVYVHIYIYTHIHIYIYVYIYYVCMCVYIYIYTYMHACIYIYIYIKREREREREILHPLLDTTVQCHSTHSNTCASNHSDGWNMSRRCFYIGGGFIGEQTHRHFGCSKNTPWLHR